MILEILAKAVGGKLALEFIKKLGKKLETPPIEKAFEEAVCAFAEGFSLEDTENEGILRSFFENKKVRKELINFTGFFGGSPDVDALKKEFVNAGFVEEQMPGFNFEQGILRFVKTFKEVSSQNSELQPFLQTKVQEEILKELRKVSETITPPIPDLEQAEKNYLKQIQLQNKYVDARGIAQMKNIVQLELDQIFVPLKAKEEVPGADTITREESQKTKEALEIREEEYGFLRDESMERDGPALSIDHILKTQRNFVILGDPDSGKTTLMKHLTFRAASGGLGEDIADGKNLLPILLPIRQYSAALSKGACRSLKGYLPVFFEENEFPLPDEFLEKKLLSGECLLLFDGLDEVFDPHRRHEIVDDIANFLNRYSDNRFILTSRIAGYSAAPMVGGFPHYTLEDFGLDEIEQFVHKWCWAMENIDRNEGASRKRAEANTKELFDAMKINDRVLKLASNPLMCTIIGLIHHQGQKLPNRRIELYNICADTFITSWELLKREKTETFYELDERDVRAILEHVALWMQWNAEHNLIKAEVLEEKVVEFLMRRIGKRRIDAEKQTDAFLELVRVRTGLFLEKGGRLFGFMHLTFQEYFAACALTKERDRFISEIGNYVKKTRWKEVVLLAAARLGDYNPEDASELVRAILNVEDEYERYLLRNLLLAGECLVDDVMLDFNLRKEIVAQLSYWFKTVHVPFLRTKIVRLIRSMWATRSESECRDVLISALSHKRPDVVASAVHSLGKLGVRDKEVVDSIMSRLEDKHRSVRCSAVTALGSLRIREKHLVQKIMKRLEDKERSVRCCAIAALGAMGDDDQEVVDRIIDRLGDRDDKIRSSAVAALASLGAREKVVDAVIKRVDNQYRPLRCRALRALGSLGIKQEKVLEKIMETLEEEDRYVRPSAVRALGLLRITNKQVVDKIMEVLDDKNRFARFYALKALASCGLREKEVVDKIMQRLDDGQALVRSCAAKALSSLGVTDTAVVDRLVETLKDETPSVRSSAVRALGSLGVTEKQVVNEMVGVLEDQYGPVRSSAVRALASLSIGDKRVVSKIVEMLDDENSSVRSSAIRTLNSLRVKDVQVLSKIIGRLDDSDWRVRCSAVRALGSLGVGKKPVLHRLLQMVDDANSSVRSSAVVALASLRFREKVVVDRIVRLLNDRDRSLRSSAYKALATLTAE